MRENEEDFDRNFELLTNFVKVVKQERMSPALLSFEKRLFDEVQLLVEDQRSKLKDYLRYEDEYETKVSNKNFKYMIYSAEIEKVDYLLKTYLKTRLRKLQQFCFYLIKNEQLAEQLLSEHELKFLRKYAELRYEYFKDNALKFLLKNYRDFKGIQSIFKKGGEEQREPKLLIETKQSMVELKEPNLSEHVFAEILTNPKQLRFGINLHASNTNTEQMEVVSPGTIIFGPYRQIADQFQPDQYRLI